MDEDYSLGECLRRNRVPLENHKLIRALTEGIGIQAFYLRSGYIKAVRHGEGPALHIFHGITNGFVSEEEARRFAEGAEVYASQRIRNTWGVIHPKQAPHPSADTPRHAMDRRDYGTCPVCFTKYTVTGACCCG